MLLACDVSDRIWRLAELEGLIQSPPFRVAASSKSGEALLVGRKWRRSNVYEDVINVKEGDWERNKNKYTRWLLFKVWMWLVLMRGWT